MISTYLSMNVSKKLIYLCAAVLTAILSVGCSESEGKDDPESPAFEEGIPTEVRITLSARSGNETRGFGTAKDPTSSIELMHDGWWIVFVSKKGDVKMIKQSDIPEAERIKSRPSTVPAPDGTTTDGGFEAETFKIILPSGKYRIYAFANIEAPASAQAFINKYLKTENGVVTSHHTVYINELIGPNRFKDPSNPQNDGMQWPATDNIPMSGVMTDREIKNTVEEVVNIEVVRAVAKVEFAFSNPGNETIALQKLEFGPITKAEKISFVPNYSAIGKAFNKKLYEDVLGEKDGTGTLSFNTFTLTVESEKYNMGKFGFYCKESVPDTVGGGFSIKLNVKRGGEDKTYEYQTKAITYINRNDWILIPISFTDWLIRWRMHYYPPIGGYPPLFEQTNDGSDVYLVATTPGEFEFYPDITGDGGAYTLTEAEWRDVTVLDVKETDKDGKQLPEGTSLFVKSPVKQEAKGNVAGDYRYYISGEFSNTPGIATVVVQFKLAGGPYANQLKTCTFHISRQNSAH